MRTRTLSLLLLLLIAGCEAGGGRQYIDDLSAMIRRSDRIVVTEHSSSLDAYDFESETSPLPEQVVYATRELSQAQRQKFLHTIENLAPAIQDAFPACVPEIHHTVHFYSHGELISKMEICFECGQVIWNATKATPPWALYSGLASFIEDIGLEPERDWDALAKKHASVQRE
jgi:hypothetical protein